MRDDGRPRQLVLIRHVESFRNKAKKGSTYFADDEARKVVAGITDHRIELTNIGERQALETGVAVRRRYGITDYVYHSGYSRTERTAELILKAYTAAERFITRTRRNAFIREREPGYTYDMTTDEAEVAFPWLRGHWKTFGEFFARPPGDENLADVTNRVYAFVNMLFRDRECKSVFVVTHGETIRCFKYILERWSYEQALKWEPDQSLANCGTTTYEYDEIEKGSCSSSTIRYAGSLK